MKWKQIQYRKRQDDYLREPVKSDPVADDIAIELPHLPEPVMFDAVTIDGTLESHGYSGSQMAAYAKEAVRMNGGAV